MPKNFNMNDKLWYYRHTKEKSILNLLDIFKDFGLSDKYFTQGVNLNYYFKGIALTEFCLFIFNIPETVTIFNTQHLEKIEKISIIKSMNEIDIPLFYFGLDGKVKILRTTEFMK